MPKLLSAIVLLHLFPNNGQLEAALRLDAVMAKYLCFIVFGHGRKISKQPNGL